MNRIKLILTFIVIVGIIGGLLYLIAINANKAKSDKIEHINKNYGYAKGIIVKKKSYKGHSIEVKYQIGNKEYKYTGGWDNNPNNLGEGDSIKFRYAIDNPELILTELNNGY
ncbi:hypothetical protein GO495_09425 [Chitinophaga oryziterrae]|uniref:DUF3592 domain-containing protein n=1 Tax=Chitinophaga oryziterrae TaxID=1031224 RepID=A0A6N8J6C9_9BACT|nr:hypothetical protein [Chitinophaga oryziterrae]MVT40797.1 hypothetical protein [Chitinophaga oryziterrae]